MKITKKQVDGINAKCKNGFHFDIRSCIELGDKRLTKSIIVKEGEKLIEVSLYWVQEIFKKKNDHGCDMPYYSRNMFPQLRVLVWTKNKGAEIWHSNGLGGCHRFDGHPSPKKLMNNLCQATELISDDLIRSLLSEYECEACMAMDVSKKTLEAE